jgi:hypothetical protein
MDVINQALGDQLRLIDPLLHRPRFVHGLKSSLLLASYFEK